MLECLEIRIGFWVVATIMAANDGFLVLVGKWLQNILKVIFFVTQSLQFQTRISSESPRCRIILLFKSAKDTNVKNAFDLLIINALAIWELSWWFFGWLDVVKSFSIGCDWIFEMSTDSYWMVLKYRIWWIC